MSRIFYKFLDVFKNVKNFLELSRHFKNVKNLLKRRGKLYIIDVYVEFMNILRRFLNVKKLLDIS